MHTSKHSKTTESIDHPLLVEACTKKAPDGFIPIRQYMYCQLGNIRKRCLKDYGNADDFHIEPGHFRIIKEGGKLYIASHREGCIIFVRKEVWKRRHAPVPKRRLLFDPTLKRTVEAGAPDWSKECSSCGDKPVVPQTGMCGPCTWGEYATEGGNW